MSHEPKYWTWEKITGSRNPNDPNTKANPNPNPNPKPNPNPNLTKNRWLTHNLTGHDSFTNFTHKNDFSHCPCHRLLHCSCHCLIVFKTRFKRRYNDETTVKILPVQAWIVISLDVGMLLVSVSYQMQGASLWSICCVISRSILLCCYH